MKTTAKRRRAPRWLRSLWRSKTGMVGFIIVAVVMFCAVFAPYIAPYDPNAKYKAQAAQKTTAKGKNGRGRQGNTSQRGNQRREKNRQKRERG